MANIDTANPPQEYPDIVGARPTNPLAANFKPFIPASVQLPEMTLFHLLTGTVLGIIFSASSLYLVLKVGLTVSASIPVAVISITIFRIFSKFGFRDGAYADLLALIPFIFLSALLYLAGRDILFKTRPRGRKA
jgi:hypothetical protein